MKLLIKFPTMSRPEKFINTLNKYYSNLSGNNDYQFIISLNEDDMTMNNKKMLSFLDSKPNLKYFFGNHKTKIQAINADVEKADNDWDVILLASDDMIPYRQKYDMFILNNMNKHFPNMDGALHFNDGRAGRKLLTLSILGRKLYDEFGYIYHPDYISLWCDNEFMDVVKQMNKYVFVDRIIIKHDWIDYTGTDSLHKRNESFFGKDKQTYLKRKAKGFPKKSIF